MNKYYFIMGGADLEMLEIKKILDQEKIQYYKGEHTWNNAFWKKHLQLVETKTKEGYIIVGVELLGKKDRPNNLRIIDIDHHNYDRFKASSLEQVADLLDIKLNPWQKKVAINDKSYIPGLLKSGVSIYEIEEIRQKDRITQGLSVKDCPKAKVLLEKQPPVKDVKSGLTIWQVPDDWKSFVPLFDTFFLKKMNHCFEVGQKQEECVKELEKIKLIIYNKNKFNYSGYIPAEIIEKYKSEIEEEKAYFGGAGNRGYFGFAKNYLEEKEVENLIIEWKKIMKKNKATTDQILNQEMHSYHIFLFPFRWRVWDINDNTKMSNKFNLQEFEKYLIEEREIKLWKSNTYKLQDGVAYNEYNYFYDFVREVLYDLGEDLQISTNLQNEELIRHYEYILPQNNEKKLHYNIKVKNKTYSLEIDSILLNIYSTGIGVLSFHLRNFNYPKEKDILTINKFGRRIYPPFFNLRNESIKSIKDNTMPEEWLSGVKNNELPQAIWLSNAENIIGDIEDFSEYYCKDNFKHGPFRLPKYIKALFPDKFFLTHEKTGCKRYDNAGKHCIEKDTDFKIYLRPALDDRMYTLSWYGNDKIAERLQKIDYGLKPAKYQYTKDEFWHNYIFVDTSRTYQNQLKLPEFIEEHTYSRWVDYGTLYGFSRYSMVMLTASLDKLENLNAAFLVRHIQSMYYKMAELTLLQRSTIISFSDEVTHVSDLIHQEEEDLDQAIEKIEDLYKHYILFVNKIFFREVTAQEQGIEMYDMVQKIMRIPEQVKDLDNEIAELNAFAGMIADKNENKENKKLSNEAHSITKIGVYFAIASVLTGLFGMNIMPESKLIPKYLFGKPHWAFWIGTVIIATITYYVGKKMIKKLENI